MEDDLLDTGPSASAGAQRAISEVRVARVQASTEHPPSSPHQSSGGFHSLEWVVPTWESDRLAPLKGWPDWSPTARNFLTRPPTGTPRRATSPSEGLLFPSLHHRTFSPKGVAGLSFTARIGRAQFHRARSASKKDGLAAPFHIFLRPRVARAKETNGLPVPPTPGGARGRTAR